jgi:hypothetical protein
MNIKDVINTINSDKIEGLQLSKRLGIISSTWLLYKKNEVFYYFDINQKIEFTDSFKYSEEELITEFANSNFQIDLIIN